MAGGRRAPVARGDRDERRHQGARRSPLGRVRPLKPVAIRRRLCQTAGRFPVRSFSFFTPSGRRLRALLVLSGAVAAVASAASVPASQARPKDERLNVVVILSDDERTDGTSVMKNVQRLLADHGVTFADYHVTSSLCGPSRASILSGQYSHHTGVYDNFGPHSVNAFNAQSTLATWLHGAGYQTALVGKYINAFSTWGHHSIPPGWDDWQALDSVPL